MYVIIGLIYGSIMGGIIYVLFFECNEFKRRNYEKYSNISEVE